MKCVPGRMSPENQTQCFPPMSLAATTTTTLDLRRKVSVERKTETSVQVTRMSQNRQETQTTNRPVLEAGEAEVLMLQQCPKSKMGFGAIRAKPQVGLAPGQAVNTEEVAVHEREFVDKF